MAFLDFLVRFVHKDNFIEYDVHLNKILPIWHWPTFFARPVYHHSDGINNDMTISDVYDIVASRKHMTYSLLRAAQTFYICSKSLKFHSPPARLMKLTNTPISVLVFSRSFWSTPYWLMNLDIFVYFGINLKYLMIYALKLSNFGHYVMNLGYPIILAVMSRQCLDWFLLFFCPKCHKWDYSKWQMSVSLK